MKSRPFSFPKSVRLRLKSDFDHLFLKGKTFREHPVKVIYTVGPASGEPLQSGLVVPKKLFKRAVNRNRIKRLMREALRLNASTLREHLLKTERSLKMLLIFTGKELPEYAVVQSKIILILQRLQLENEMAPHKGASGPDNHL